MIVLKKQLFSLMVIISVITLSLISCDTSLSGEGGGDGDGGVDGETEQVIDLLSIDDDRIPYANYTVNTTDGYLEVTSGTSVTHYILSHPYQAHAAPFTGHTHGKLTGNWLGFFVTNKAPMTQLAVDTYGVIEADIINNAPWYICPVDNFTITSVELHGKIETGLNYYIDYKWTVAGNDGNARISFDHLGELHKAFKNT